MTNLRLARELRVAFPQIVDVKITRPGEGRLRVYFLRNAEGPDVALPDIMLWLHRNATAGASFEVEEVGSFPDGLVDEEELLRRAGLPRVVIEQSFPTRQGITGALRLLFPEDVVCISGGGDAMVVHVVPELDPSREQPILDAMRLLLSFDVRSPVISRQPAPADLGEAPSHRTAESAAARKLLAQDSAFLLDHLQGAVGGESIHFPSLPSGSSTYASVHDGIQSLFQRLALFDRVYVFIPFRAEHFSKWAGASFDDFITTLPTGRIVPVFAHNPERYEAALISKIVDAGTPRAVFNGEMTLRTIGSFVNEHPLVPFLHTDRSGVRDPRAKVEEVGDPRLGVALGYIDAVTDIVDHIGELAVSGPSLSMGWQPVANWLIGELAKRFGFPSVELEMGVAIDHQLKTRAIGGRPMSQMGHYLDGHLMFVYGAQPGDSDLLRVPDPEMIGRIAFPDAKGLSLLEFAQSFKGPVVERMRALMSSDRVQTASGSEDLVREFNRELQHYRRVTGPEFAAYGLLVTVLGLLGGFGVPTALASLTLALTRSVLDRRAPGMLAKIEATISRSTPEAALLARIKPAT